MTTNPGSQDWGEQHQQYQQQPGAPLPPAPSLNQSEAQAVPRPRSVEISFLLWLVAAGISLVSQLLSLATQDEVTQETARRLGVSLEQAEPSMAGTVFGIALLVAWVAVVFAMRGGQNWARIVLTVLGGLSILVGVIGLFALGILFSIGVLGILQGLLSIASLLVIIAAIVMQFKADANYYFKKS